MWKVQRADEGDLVVLLVSGRIGQEHLVALRDVVSAQAVSQGIVLDMKEVKLVDQEAIQFLSQREAEGTTLRNCPAYIREWIERDK